MLVTMSAFPESGRSDQREIHKTTVRFRPKADVSPNTKNPAQGGASVESCSTATR